MKTICMGNVTVHKQKHIGTKPKYGKVILENKTLANYIGKKVWTHRNKKQNVREE